MSEMRSVVDETTCSSSGSGSSGPGSSAGGSTSWSPDAAGPTRQAWRRSETQVIWGRRGPAGAARGHVHAPRSRHLGAGRPALGAVPPGRSTWSSFVPAGADRTRRAGARPGAHRPAAGRPAAGTAPRPRLAYGYLRPALPLLAAAAAVARFAPAGTHGPLPAVYEPVASREGMHSFCLTRGLRVTDEDARDLAGPRCAGRSALVRAACSVVDRALQRSRPAAHDEITMVIRKPAEPLRAADLSGPPVRQWFRPVLDHARSTELATIGDLGLCSR